MGGKGSGGSGPRMGRWRSGPAKKDARAVKLGGNAGRRTISAGETQVPVASSDVVRPADLDGAAAETWNALAPFALAAGTLTPATALAFAFLCRVVVEESVLRNDPEKRSGADHRGIMARMNDLLGRFGLHATGKPMAVPKPAEVDPFAEFDGPKLAVNNG
jgi:hypothetical protein